MVAEKLNNLLGRFLDTNKEVRETAENEYKTLERNSPSELSQDLLYILKFGDLEKKQQAAIALKNLYYKQNNNLWDRIDDQSKEIIKTGLFEVLNTETNQSVTDVCCHLVGDLGRTLYFDNDWPNLQNLVFNLFFSSNENTQIAGTKLLAQLSSTFINNIDHDQIIQVLQNRFNSYNKDLIIAMIKLLCSIVLIVEYEIYQKYLVFSATIVSILKHFTQKVYEENDVVLFNAVMGELIEIADQSPKFFKEYYGEIISILIEITNHSDFSDSGKVLAMEFIIVLSKNKRKFISKQPELLERIVYSLMNFLMAEDESKEWFYTELGEIDSQNALCEAGEFGLDSLASALDSEILLPIIFRKVGFFMQYNSWIHKEAALTTIHQTVEYLSEKYLESDLSQVMQLILTHCSDPHYRVRFAALHALAQVSLDHQPLVQMMFHSSVLPVIIKCFDDPVGKVQTQAFAAFINYTEEVEEENCIEYLPTVVEKIFIRLDPNFALPPQGDFTPVELQKMHLHVKEHCVTALSVIAGIMGDSFIQSYPDLVNIMQAVVNDCSTPEMKQLRGRALECVTIIAFCVGKDKMKDQCDKICNTLVSLFLTGLEDTDTTKEYVFDALKRMAQCMGTDFAPYGTKIIPNILEGLSYETVDAHNIDNLNDYAYSSNEADEFTAVKTSKIEEIVALLSLLSSILENIGSYFDPYVQTCINVIGPLINMSYSNIVRRQALTTLAELMGALRLSSNDVATIQQLVVKFIEIVVLTVSNNYDLIIDGVSYFTGVVNALKKCIEKVGSNILNEKHVVFICEKIFEMVSQSNKRRDNLENAKNAKDLDEEDIDYCDEERDREQLFRESCLAVLDSLMKNNPEEFLRTCSQSVISFIDSLMKNQTTDDRILAIFVCCDVIDTFKSRGVALLGNLLEPLVVAMHDSDPGVRQSACYAISLALKIPNLDPTIVIESANRLMALIHDKDAKKKQNLGVTENAISGILNLIIYQSKIVQDILKQCVNVVVNGLPLEKDTEEGIYVHSEFFKSLLQPDTPFLTSLTNEERPLYKQKYYLLCLELYNSSSSTQECNLMIENVFKLLVQDPELKTIFEHIKYTAKQNRGYQKLLAKFKN